MSAATRSARSALSAACSGLLRISLWAFSRRTTSFAMTVRRFNASSKLRIFLLLLFCRSRRADTFDQLGQLLTIGRVSHGVEHAAQLAARAIEHPRPRGR